MPTGPHRIRESRSPHRSQRAAPAAAALPTRPLCVLWGVPLSLRGHSSGAASAGFRRLSMNYELTVPVHGQGLYDVTHKVAETVRRSAVTEGLATVFICHTSASLVIQENAEGTARQDLERWLNRLVPERDPLYTHTVE